MESNVLTRQELYELVWSEPLTSIIKRFGLTDFFIRRVCKEMMVPLPGPGYWSKIRYGKKVEWDELPSDYKGKKEVDFSSNAGSDPLVKKLKEILNDSHLNLKVPKTLSNPDPLIVDAKQSLSKKDRRYQFTNLLMTEWQKLDIKVSKECIDRSLRIYDTLIKAIKARGHSITTPYDITYVTVLGQKIEMKMREKVKRLPGEREWNEKYQNTGILVIKVGRYSEQKEYVDGKLTLEEQLPMILAKIETIAEKACQRQQESQKCEEERKMKELLERELEQRKQRELAKFTDLLSKSKRRYKAEMIRNFIDIKEKRAIEMGTMDDRLENWIKWARKKADWYDPFMEADDELLRGVDRTSLTFLNRK